MKSNAQPAETSTSAPDAGAPLSGRGTFARIVNSTRTAPTNTGTRPIKKMDAFSQAACACKHLRYDHRHYSDYDKFHSECLRNDCRCEKFLDEPQKDPHG